MQKSESDFTRTIKKCWSRETAMDPVQRSEQNPSYSQCLATALLAQQELGLSICVEKILDPTTPQARYHFFNKDNNNKDIRFCEDQFKHIPPTQIHKEKEKIVDAEHLNIILEWNPIIKQKYEILKQRFEKEIKTTMA